jgi:hypothetical protein
LISLVSEICYTASQCVLFCFFFFQISFGASSSYARIPKGI